MIKKLLPIICFVVITGIFFWQFLFKGLLPIPADTIIGLYHPYRDSYAKSYPNGIPFKNFLITDPVRQEYPWRNLSINQLKKFDLPAWNPYSFSGAPNIANLQSAAFYPLNVIFLVLPFEYAWSFLIMLQPLLASIFMYLYLRNRKLDELSSFFGGATFAFGGFFTTWLEWGTVLQVALWLPLILLSLDKLLQSERTKQVLIWTIILIFSLSSSFFAGHLQTFFYVFIASLFYAVFRWFENGKNIKKLIPVGISLLFFILISAIQWIPTLQFLNLSARSLDQNYLTTLGWFIPWQHVVQFLVPDFFGNPATLNYWGTWNYGELTGYIGVIGLLFSSFAIFYRRTKEVWFFTILLLASLLFAMPTIFAKLPFVLNLPFVSTSQPTRLIFLVDFCLSILSAFGINYYLQSKQAKKILISIVLFGIFYVLIIVFIQIGSRFGIDPVNLSVAKRNLILPVIIFALSSAVALFQLKLDKKFRNYVVIILILLTIFDLFRFSWKFNPFTNSAYLYPSTSSIQFLQNNLDDYRVATNDSRIFPPNFSTVYKIRSVEGYDPLFLQRYGEFISAINRNLPNISPPFGFNRIVRLENFDSRLVDLLGVKYLLSLTDIKNQKFNKVFQEGDMRIYENENLLPRAFIVQEVSSAKNKQDAISKMFGSTFDPINNAVIEGTGSKHFNVQGSVSIVSYAEEKIVIQTDIDADGFLVLTDVYYPTWHAKIDLNKDVKIYQTDYIFRGIFVPKGKHTIIFYNSLL